jgi:hypothetical protein
VTSEPGQGGLAGEPFVRRGRWGQRRQRRERGAQPGSGQPFASHPPGPPPELVLSLALGICLFGIFCVSGIKQYPACVAGGFCLA